MDTKEKLMELLEKIDELKKAVASQSVEQQKESGYLKFTEKEIIQMPKDFRKKFRVQGHTAHVRKRTDGRYVCSYEIRYERDGYKISASGTTLETAKKRFIDKLKTAVPCEKGITVPHIFNDFAEYWFINFHQRKVKTITFNVNYQMYKRHIKPHFEKMSISKITPLLLQNFLDKFEDKGKTADDIYSILNQIFQAAVKHGLIRLSPLSMIFHKQHDKQHGKALSKDEERLLLNIAEPYRTSFAFILYTGLRPCEYSSAKVDGEFIIAINGKRKGSKTEYKKIPITKKLRPFLSSDKIPTPSPNVLKIQFKRILPNHKLYDMRTTFQTRCTECGISDAAIGFFMGNSIGVLKDAYTDLSEEYLLQEGKKFDY